MSVRRKNPFNQHILSLKIIFMKIPITEKDEFNFRMGLCYATECIGSEITNTIQLFVTKHPAINGNFHL